MPFRAGEGAVSAIPFDIYSSVKIFECIDRPKFLSLVKEWFFTICWKYFFHTSL